MLAPQDQAYQEQPVLTVSALARRARLLIEEAFGFVQVEGEISNLRQPGSGHWYFTLKDESAQLRCAMFAGRNRRVGFEPRDGQQVLIKGRVSLYEARGDFQIIADQMEPAGEGALRAAFEVLKRKLATEGLFAETRKRTLPELPRHVTIISSASGAALRDVVHVIERRFPALGVTLIPSLVQGDGAESMLVAALAKAAELDTDVVLLTRGGGSLEDLWPFNLETVARAIAASPHPVVTAIGHQTDFTIADFVADLRAPTPSAGAELITPSREALQAAVTGTFRRLVRGNAHELKLKSHRVAVLRARLVDPRAQLAQRMQLADDLDQRLRRAQAAQLQICAQKLASMSARLELLQPGRMLPGLERTVARTYSDLRRAMHARLAGQQLTLGAKVRALQAVSPLNTLSRGYAVLTNETGPVTSVAQAQRGDSLTAFLTDGALDMQVTDVTPGRRLTPDV